VRPSISSQFGVTDSASRHAQQYFTRFEGRLGDLAECQRRWVLWEFGDFPQEHGFHKAFIHIVPKVLLVGEYKLRQPSDVSIRKYTE